MSVWQSWYSVEEKVGRKPWKDCLLNQDADGGLEMSLLSLACSLKPAKAESFTLLTQRIYLLIPKVPTAVCIFLFAHFVSDQKK